MDGNDSFSRLAWLQSLWQIHGFCPKLHEHDGVTSGMKPETPLEEGCSATVTRTQGNDHHFYFCQGMITNCKELGGQGKFIPHCCFALQC